MNKILNTKAIIVTGGKGTRIPELTGGKIPKSISFVLGKPVIYYQIKTLLDFGIKDFLLVFEKDWQLALFNNLLKNNFLPKAKYSACIIDWAKESNPFNTAAIKNFTRNQKINFLFSHGDVFYSKKFIDKLLTLPKDSLISCFYDRNKKIYIAPVLFKVETFLKLNKIKKLDIQKFFKKEKVKLVPLKKTDDYVNINTKRDLDYFIKLLKSN